MSITIYKTRDFLTAVVLTLRRHRLVRTTKENPKRIVFEFEKTSKLEKDIEDLKNDELRVSPVAFWIAERRCKQMLYDS